MPSDEKTRIIQNSSALDRGVRLNDTYEIDERIASGGMGGSANFTIDRHRFAGRK